MDQETINNVSTIIHDIHVARLVKDYEYADTFTKKLRSLGFEIQFRKEITIARYGLTTWVVKRNVAN